jgi:hypothetical protein
MEMPELPGPRRPTSESVTATVVVDLLPHYSPDDGRGTQLARAVHMLAALAGCEAQTAAVALLSRAVRDHEDVELFAARVIDAMSGDGSDSERLVVALVESALARDSIADRRV